MANSIYPPVLPSKQYSFLYYANPDTHYMIIQFEMPSMTSLNLANGHCQVSVKYAETGKCAIADGYCPDRATVFITALQQSGTDTNPYFHKVAGASDNIWEICLPYRIFDGGNVKPNTNYSVQIRFGGMRLWDGYDDWGLRKEAGYKNFAAWRKTCTTAIPSLFGEWSNTTRIFCYEAPGIKLEYNFYDFLPEIGWTYTPISDDPMAEITIEYSYQTAEETITESQIFTGTTDADNQFSLTKQFNIAPLYGSITGTIHGLTQNNTKVDCGFIIPAIQVNDTTIDSKNGKFKVWDSGEVTDLELGAIAQEDGILGKQIISKTSFTEAGTDQSYTLNIYRVDLLNLKTVKVASDLVLVKDEKLKFKDYTAAMGDRYEYIFGVISHNATAGTENQMQYVFINPVSPYGEGNPGYGRLMRMDAAFLDDPNHQLKLIGNLKISAFKRNTSDNFQTTIGAKYPFYSRNSNMNYRTLQLSAAISINFDQTATFLRLDPENGLMWDEGNAVITMTNTTRQSMATIQARIATNQSNLEAEEAKMTTHSYKTNKDYRDEVNSKIAQYTALIEADKSILATYKDTRGKSSLAIWDTDLYSDTEISLSRRRARGKSGGPDTLEQEMAEDPFGLHDKSAISGPQAIFSEMLYKQEGIEYDTSSSDRMVYLERVFRDYVMNWLSNGYPKLFRSENEGNMIVMVSGISFAPLDATDRKVYTLSCTLTEIADYDLDELINYNLIPSVIESNYEDVNLYDFCSGDIDQNVHLGNIGFSHIENYYIGKMAFGEQASRDLSQIVVNAQGNLTFTTTASTTGLSLTSAGLLTWKPVQSSASITELNSQIVPIRVTDAAGHTATTSLFIDTVHRVPEVTTYPGSTITNKKIGEYYEYQCAASYGQLPLIWYAANLPEGLSIDSTNGTIYGTFAQESSTTISSSIWVEDDCGHKSSPVTVNFASIGSQLVFNADYLHTIPVGEVGTAIDSIDFSVYASGGKKISDTSGEHYNFSLIGAPSGITINSTTGILSGTPTAANASDVVFVVRCTDANGTYIDAHVTMKRVVAQFKIKTYETNKTTYTGAITYDFKIENNVMVKMAVGDQVTGGVWSTLTDSVTGGDPWESSDGTYYKFESEGLEPNFQIDPTTGKITGVPGVGTKGKTTATVKVKDRRGKYAKDDAGNDYIIVTISQIAAEMYVKGGKGVFNLPETIRDNQANHNGVLDAYLTDAYGFTFNISDHISGGIGPFTLRYDNADFPGLASGATEFVIDNTAYTISFREKNARTSGKIANLNPFSPKTSYFYVKDSLEQEVAIQVNVGQIYETLNWTQTQTKVPNESAVALYAGDTLDFDFTNISGGKPNYKFTEIKNDSSGLSHLPLGVSLQNNDVEISTISGFYGVVKETNNSVQTVTVKLWDELGQYVQKNFSFCKVYYHMELSVNKAVGEDGVSHPHSMDNYNFITNLTQIKAHDASNPQQIGVTNPDTHKIGLKPFNISGGSGSYKFHWASSSVGDPFGGMTITNEGYLEGTPTIAHPLTWNLNRNLWVEDLLLGEIVTLQEECWTAPIYDPPTLAVSDPQTINGSTDNAITPITNIFNGNGNGSLTYGHGDTFNYAAANAPYKLPSGLDFNDDGTYSISGRPLDSCSNYTAIVWVRIEGNNWTDSPDPPNPLASTTSFKICHITCNISGFLRISINSNISAGGIGDAIEKTVIGADVLGASNYVTGGTKPYTYTWTYDTGVTTDPGISIAQSGNNLIIQGTRTIASDGYKIYVTVTDADGATSTANLNYGGAYPKLYFNYSSDFDIPSMMANQTLSKTIKFIQGSASKGVYGGVAPYSFIYYGLGDYGNYTINGTTGLLTGIAKSSAQEAGSTQITVMDSVGQSASITINIGAVIGKLAWSESLLRIGESIHWDPGYKGEAFNAVHLADGCSGGQGAKTWSITNVTKTAWTPQLTINASTGELIAGTRPKTKVTDKVQVTIKVQDSTNSVNIFLDAGSVTGIYWSAEGGTDFGDGTPGSITQLTLGDVSCADPFTVTFNGTYASCLAYDTTTKKLVLTRPSAACGDQLIDVIVTDNEGDSETRSYHFSCND